MNKSDGNKFLIVWEGVVLNPLLDGIIHRLDPVFEKAGRIAYVTSGVRLPEDQLRIIRYYVKRNGIQDEFIANATVTGMVDWNARRIFGWQLAWSKLLNAGVIINPPVAAQCLLDYVNKAGVNKKGQIIPPSVHFRGMAFDIGGGSNSIADETEILTAAMAGGAFPEIKGLVPERENNCLHVDVQHPGNVDIPQKVKA